MNYSELHVTPTGSIDSKYWIVGEAPGKTEFYEQVQCSRGRRCVDECEGHTFLGDAGKTLNIWLQKAGIPRDSFYTLNTVPFWPGYVKGDENRYPKKMLGDGSQKPTLDSIQAHKSYLLDLISTYSPEVIIALGSIAIQVLLEGTEESKYGMESLVGRPCRSKYGPIVLPVVHPSAGLHDPLASVQTWLGLQSAANYINQNHTPDSWFGKWSKPKFSVLHGAKQVEQVFSQAKRSASHLPSREFEGTPVDTEGYPSDPWSLQFSTGPNTGYLIWASDKEALQAFYRLAPRPFIFHNVLYDLDLMEALGIPLKDDEYACTLVKTYVTAREMASGKTDSDEASVRGQGLKSLAYKYLRQKMVTWDELTQPALEKITREYLGRIQEAGKGPTPPEVVSSLSLGFQPQEEDLDLDYCLSFKVRMAKDMTPKEYRKAFSLLKKELKTREILGLENLVDRRLICKCNPTKRHSCVGLIVSKRVLELPGAFDIKGEGRSHSLSKRVTSLLKSKDLVSKWGKLLDSKPDWKQIIEAEFGPVPRLKLKDIDPDAFLSYSCDDPIQTGRLNTVLNRELESSQLWTPYSIDMSIVPMLREMNHVGLKVDVDKLRELEVEVGKESERLYRQLRTIAWSYGIRDLNPDSGDSVAKLIYGPMKLEGGRVTKTGRNSVDEKSLSSLYSLTEIGANAPVPEGPARFIKLLLDYKEVQKLITTYIRPLYDYIESDGRIHPQWRHTVTVSGRLACQRPNLLAMPNRSEWGKQLLECFVAEEGNVILNTDLCLAPETRVLTADLKWRPLDSVCVGERLVAIDEHLKYLGKRRSRQMRTARVTRKIRKKALCFEIKTSDGRTIIASDEHPWLVRDLKGSKPSIDAVTWEKTASRVYKWRKTKDLRAGLELFKLVSPWEEKSNWGIGWLSGVFDGEGSLDREGATLTFTQNDGVVLRQVQKYLKELGYDFHKPYSHGGGFPGSGVAKQLWMCGVAECLHFLGVIRPFRLLEDVERVWEGKEVRKQRPGKTAASDQTNAYIVSVTNVGTREVIGIQTTTNTFVAEGFFTHNSQIELRVLASESRDPVMIDAYLNGIDLHDLSIKNVLGLDPKSAEGLEQRVVAKMGNFSACYGIQGPGLQTRLAAAGFKRSLQFCEDFIAGKRREWEVAFAFLDQAAVECAEEGFVRDMWGRLRYLPMIWSLVFGARGEAARQAGNMKIQGGAQGVEKMGMYKWWTEARPQLPNWRPLVQVHDAVMFEGPESELEKAKKITVECFETAAQDRFIVPIRADSKSSRSWGGLYRKEKKKK